MPLLFLALLLQLNRIDEPAAALRYPPDTQEALIETLMRNDYQPPFRVVRAIPPVPVAPLLQPAVPISAIAGAVIDVSTGAVLWERAPTAALPIASLTKLMTAMVFLGTNTDWDQEVEMTAADNANVEGSFIRLQPGERIKVIDLFYSMLVGSANNAARALARSTGLSETEFVSRMNAEAERQGLQQTEFHEVTGLDPENKSTPIEYARLASVAMRHSRIRDALTRADHLFETTNTHRPHRVGNTDKLLGDPGVPLIGAKTGYLDEAGFTFVAEAESDGHQVLVVLFRSATSEARFSEAKELIRWVFVRYRWF